MSISTVSVSMQQWIPSLGIMEGKYSLSLPRIARNLNKVAIPAIALFAFSFLSSAEAGPASYATCIAVCMSLATPVALPACTVGCLALAGPWCP